MSLQASEALQEIGKVVRRFELRCVAGLDLDRLDAEDLPCRPDHALGREDLVVSRVDERGRNGGRALELEFTVIRVRPEL